MEKCKPSLQLGNDHIDPQKWWILIGISFSTSPFSGCRNHGILKTQSFRFSLQDFVLANWFCHIGYEPFWSYGYFAWRARKQHNNPSSFSIWPTKSWRLASQGLQRVFKKHHYLLLTGWSSSEMGSCEMLPFWENCFFVLDGLAAWSLWKHVLTSNIRTNYIFVDRLRSGFRNPPQYDIIYILLFVPIC